MICRKSSRYSKGILICLIYVILTLFPVFYLVFSGGKGDLKIWNARRAGLMVNSLITALFTVMACLLVAVFSSLKIYTSFKKRPLLRWYFLLLAPVPSYIYALSYMNLIRFAGRFFPGVLRWRMSGIFPCVLVESFAYLPLALAAALTALERISEDEWNAALLFDSADMVFLRWYSPNRCRGSWRQGRLFSHCLSRIIRSRHCFRSMYMRWRYSRIIPRRDRAYIR